MFQLQRLGAGDEAAVLAFERENRTYFSAFINDRGDEFFEQFAERFRGDLDEQAAGKCAFHVLVDEEGQVVGRFNLYALTPETAVVGYRLARRVAGRGAATSALRDLCQIARDELGLRTLRAATSSGNVASQRVLAKAGFVAVGPAEVGGREGCWYELALEHLSRPPS